MPDSVTDTLVNWQPDASTNDSNLPQPLTPMGTGDSGDLAGELRRIKSEVRGISIAMSWERWLGLKNLAGTGNIAFTFVGVSQFTVNDNFVAPNRNVAVVGRKVRSMQPTGPAGFITGTISGATFSSPNTLVTVSWDAGVLSNTFTEIQFGPEPDAINTGGGGSITLGGDLSGTPAAATVVGIQGSPVSGTAPTAGDFLQFNGAQYVPTAVTAPGGIVISRVVFNSSGTWTKPANLVAANVRMVGAGGGGGAANGALGETREAAGGGGGGYCEKLFQAGSLGATEAVQVGGAGGGGATPSGNGGDGQDSIFNTLTAFGGSGGTGQFGGAACFGGAGGAATGGDINIPGQYGGGGGSLGAIALGSGGAGGSSLLGHGGASIKTGDFNNAQAGRAGGNYGGGGGGGSVVNLTFDEPGGAGADGIVIIDQYIQT